ncbi:hypothetical protein ACLOJK_027243, partial [Asimina triloba]
GRYATGAPSPSSPWSRPQPTAGEWKTGRSMPPIFFILLGRFQIYKQLAADHRSNWQSAARQVMKPSKDRLSLAPPAPSGD